MEDKLFLKLKNGDVHFIDDFVDFNMFMESIDGFLEHHETAAHYTTQFFRLSVDRGNALAFHVNELVCVYLERNTKVDESSNERTQETRKETELKESS